MGKYLAEVNVDGRKGVIADDDNKPRLFPSIDALKDALHSGTFGKAYLLYQSAYEEMCGGSKKVNHTLKVPLFL